MLAGSQFRRMVLTRDMLVEIHQQERLLKRPHDFPLLSFQDVRRFGWLRNSKACKVFAVLKFSLMIFELTMNTN